MNPSCTTPGPHLRCEPDSRWEDDAYTKLGRDAVLTTTGVLSAVRGRDALSPSLPLPLPQHSIPTVCWPSRTASDGWISSDRFAQRVAWPVQHYYDLGMFSSSLPDSNETLCMSNRQRELTLPRATAAPTATSSTYI